MNFAICSPQILQWLECIATWPLTMENDDDEPKTPPHKKQRVLDYSPPKVDPLSATDQSEKPLDTRLLLRLIWLALMESVQHRLPPTSGSDSEETLELGQ